MIPTTAQKNTKTSLLFKEGLLSAKGQKWFLREVNERDLLHLQQKFQLPEVVGRLLLNRGLNERTFDAFLSPTLKKDLPDPFHLKDMDKAVDRLSKALKNPKEKVAVFGDYDVDGATSSALLKRYFRFLNKDLTIYIPDRIREGYGPNIQALTKLKDQGHSLVITVDCGTTSFEALKYAKNISLDIIVIDHHIAEPQLPKCIALVNPNRLDQGNSPCQDCSAAGVVFMTLIALQKNLRENGYFNKEVREPNLLSLLDLVATGTVCDVVALKGINRTFVKQGLKVFANRQNKGLVALADASGIDQIPTAYHLGFQIGPRINAGGRVGKSSIGADLLSSEDSYYCKRLAEELSAYNDERKIIEADVLAEAQKKVESLPNFDTQQALIISGQNWHAGVIGIVAGRLKDQYHKPTFVITMDENGIGKGSARSISGLDIGSLIQSARQKGILENGGGHAMAGGLTIQQTHLESFREFCNERISHIIQTKKIDLTPALKIDARISPGGATLSLLEKIEALAPYGQGNPTPKFLFESLSIIKADIVGENHVRLIMTDFEKTGQLKGISFRSVGTPLGDLLLNGRGKWISVVGTLKIDEWNGSRRIQFMLDDAVES